MNISRVWMVPLFSSWETCLKERPTFTQENQLWSINTEVLQTQRRRHIELRESFQFFCHVSKGLLGIYGKAVIELYRPQWDECWENCIKTHRDNAMFDNVKLHAPSVCDWVDAENTFPTGINAGHFMWWTKVFLWVARLQMSLLGAGPMINLVEWNYVRVNERSISQVKFVNWTFFLLSIGSMSNVMHHVQFLVCPT